MGGVPVPGVRYAMLCNLPQRALFSFRLSPL